MAYEDLDDIPPIEFTPAGDTKEDQKRNLELVQPSPGFEPTAHFCADIIVRDSETTVMDFTAEQVNIRFKIDGLWHPGPTLDRESGDFMLATLKQLAGMDFRERRQRQQGSFKSLFQKKTQKFSIVSQGVKTGERVAIELDYKRPPLETYEDLGMRANMKAKISELIGNPELKNLLVIGYPNGNGYSSAWKGICSCADRLTRDFYVIQPADRGEAEEVINIFPWLYDPSKGENALSTIPDLLLKQPDVLAFPDLDDPAIIDQIVELSSSRNIPILTRHAGKHCLDGLLRLIAKKPDAKKFVDHLDGIASMRIIRKLCDGCKIPFPPNQRMLQTLGLPPGRIAELHRPMVHHPDMIDEDENPIPPCPECSGIGFKGRTGLFEFLTMNDTLRKAIVQKPQLKYLQAVAEQEGHVSMKMEGVLMIAKGETSVDELQRVLKA